MIHVLTKIQKDIFEMEGRKKQRNKETKKDSLHGQQ